MDILIIFSTIFVANYSLITKNQTKFFNLVLRIFGATDNVRFNINYMYLYAWRYW